MLENEEINAVKIMMLKLAGYTEDEINNQHILEMDISDVVKKFDEKRAKTLNNGNSKKVINIREVKDHISSCQRQFNFSQKRSLKFPHFMHITRKFQ
ncbi:MAG: hypothetical protein B2I17_09250 [Thermoplasmatales archaeon B_DKE]|nr:MAG: hypothetical protein B2I17_09250 [Thermoplasmatales archaeon B_DKE]